MTQDATQHSSLWWNCVRLLVDSKIGLLRRLQSFWLKKEQRAALKSSHNASMRQEIHLFVAVAAKECIAVRFPFNWRSDERLSTVGTDNFIHSSKVYRHDSLLDYVPTQSLAVVNQKYHLG